MQIFNQFNTANFLADATEGVEFMEGLTTDEVSEVERKSWLQQSLTKIS